MPLEYILLYALCVLANIVIMQATESPYIWPPWYRTKVCWTAVLLGPIWTLVFLGVAIGALFEREDRW